MITWGISANSHNAALAVFADEKLIFASESERFSGIKNDPNLSTDLISHAVEHYQGRPDRVCWYEKPWLKTFRQIEAGQGFNNNSPARYLKQYGITAPIKTVGHHESHAAAGYYTSEFDEACVVVIDAIGEYNTLSIWRGAGNQLKKLYTMDYPNSVGIWYSAMTQRCGLKPNEEEYILMGMAALGDPSRLYRDMLDEFINFGSDENGNPFSFKKNLHRGCLDWKPELESQQDLYDIAATTQQIYELLFERILLKAITLTNSRNLVLMGGCALNCSANPLAYKYFDKVWIMPAPGDNGSAIGAVAASMKQRIWYPGPFLGYDMGHSTSNEAIVEYLQKNRVCGLARGRAEFGPRALGNRSLIADPGGNDTKDKINAIKQREEFRPFAPAILEELAGDYFHMPGNSNSRYMQHICVARYPNLYPAIVHIDGTSRVQTVPRDGSPFRKLLELWYEKTSCPMLLNTSLNIKGQPMVNNQADAERWTKTYGVQVFT